MMEMQRADPAGARQFESRWEASRAKDSLETTKTRDKLVIPSSGREPQPRFVSRDSHIPLAEQREIPL
jgi:hypothetical protein